MREHDHLTLLVFPVAACLLFVGAMVLFGRRRSAPSVPQLLGSAGLLVVVFAHAAEASHWLPWMHWGAEHSVGHYLDLAGAVSGLALFPLGYLFHAITKR